MDGILEHFGSRRFVRLSGFYSVYILFVYLFTNRYTFAEMRDTLKLGAFIALGESIDQSDLSLEWIMSKNRLSEFLPIKTFGKKAPFDISTNSKKTILCRQLLNSIQTQKAKGHNSNTLRALFLQSCQHLSIYGAVFFQGVVKCLFVCFFWGFFIVFCFCFLFTCLFVCLFTYLFIYLFVYLFIYLFVYLFVCF